MGFLRGRYCDRPMLFPHARGADAVPLLLAQLAVRFIPTHVGQTSPGDPSWLGNYGSSPRTWGRHTNSLLIYRLLAVHPHARGADGVGKTLLYSVSGSSPRTWGRRIRKRGDQWGIGGSSPRTWGRRVTLLSRTGLLAGSSPRTWGRRPVWPGPLPVPAVHPHARGADLIFPVRTAVWLIGSSPRTWGRRNQTLQQKVFKPVHPHARGADALILII